MAILCPKCNSHFIILTGSADLTWRQDEDGNWDIIEEDNVHENKTLCCETCGHKWEKEQ